MIKLGLVDFNKAGVLISIHDFTRTAAESMRTLTKAADAKVESDTAATIANSEHVKVLAEQLGWKNPRSSAGEPDRSLPSVGARVKYATFSGCTISAVDVANGTVDINVPGVGVK